MSVSFGEARFRFENQASVRSAHTRAAYMRAVDLFLDFLGDKSFAAPLPIQAHMIPTVGDCLIEKLTADDESILKNFAQWLQQSYAPSTVELRLAGVQRWFEFVELQGWLPAGFSLKNAIALVKDRPTVKKQTAETKAIAARPDLTAMLTYYETLKPPKHYKPDTERYIRWEITRLRNAALLKTLGETGGQISAILNINADAFASRENPLFLNVIGKNGYAYRITLHDSLPAIWTYLKNRSIPPEKAAETPVFISHDAGYEGSRMSRIIAWRIVQRAAKAVGLPSVSPHDFRHWRAQQLIEAGFSLEQIREQLGHRSLHTVKIYYGHLLS
jgi:integrase